MKDNAGPSTGWRGTRTAAESLIGSSLIFIKWGFMQDRSYNYRAKPSNTFLLSHTEHNSESVLLSKASLAS